LRFSGARRLVQRAALVLLSGWVLVAAGLTVHRYRAIDTAVLATPRGVMLTTPAMQSALAEAIAFIDSHTRPGDAVAILPEGTSLLFFCDRRNPLHEEITVPGFLYEDRAIETLSALPVALVLIANRPTPEYGPTRFGVDYGQRLMASVRERFAPCGQLGPASPADALAFAAYCAR
jgi:hypothetical protein